MAEGHVQIQEEISREALQARTCADLSVKYFQRPPQTGMRLMALITEFISEKESEAKALMMETYEKAFADAMTLQSAAKRARAAGGERLDERAAVKQDLFDIVFARVRMLLVFYLYNIEASSHLLVPVVNSMRDEVQTEFGLPPSIWDDYGVDLSPLSSKKT